MLNWLRVHNLAIVQEADIEFGPAFNAITGETGAGKSVIMGALDMLFGSRADKSVIRTGEHQCEIAAEFSIQPGKLAALRTILEDSSLISPDMPDQLLIRRVITPTTNRNFVNGSPVTLGLLRMLSSYLVDVHAVNENASILEESNQLAVLDRFAGLQNDCAEVKRLWDALTQIRREREEFNTNLPSSMEATELRRDCREIEQANIFDGEDTDLEARHALAANAHTIIELCLAAENILTDSEDSIAMRLAECRRILLSLDKIEQANASVFIETIDQVRESIDSLSSSLNSFSSGVEIDENEFQEMEKRMHLLRTLKRKFGPTLTDVLAHLESTRTRLQAFEDAEIKREDFAKQENTAYQSWHHQAEILSNKRKQAAGQLETVLSEETRKLGFLQASYSLRFSRAQDNALGIDHVTFLFSANPGVPMIPLKDVASSGEVARVMLAVKTVLADIDEIPTLVFDEIDANIGGETACRVGDELAKLGRSKQIISISHLAQVAVCADTHFRVAKQAEGNTTISSIIQLNAHDRSHEIARMLGGGTAAIKHAEKMLQEAHKRANHL